VVSASSDGLLVHSGKGLFKGIGGSSVTMVDGVITTTGGIVLPAGAISSAMLASGAAATNVGTLGGGLSGTLPNPSHAFYIIVGNGAMANSGSALWSNFPAQAQAVGAGTYLWILIGYISCVAAGSLPEMGLCVTSSFTAGGGGILLAGSQAQPGAAGYTINLSASGVVTIPATTLAICAYSTGTASLTDGRCILLRIG
jgi:hypothetical protein